MTSSFNLGQEAAQGAFVDTVSAVFGAMNVRTFEVQAQKRVSVSGSFKSGRVSVSDGVRTIRYDGGGPGGFPRVEVIDDGQLNNCPFGIPAVRKWHKNGGIAFNERFFRGQRNDATHGPAIEGFSVDGVRLVVAHYVAGVESDPLCGSPQRHEKFPDGSDKLIHYKRKGVFHNPAPDIAARQEWMSPGVTLRVESYENGFSSSGLGTPHYSYRGEETHSFNSVASRSTDELPGRSKKKDGLFTRLAVAMTASVW